MAKKKEAQPEIFISKVETGIIEVVLIGLEPLYNNRLAEKARHELLCPMGKKGAAEKASKMKHDPIEEFRSSIHRFSDPSTPTLLGIPSAAPKKAMASAALDIPGAKKAQIGRLVWVHGHLLPVYGTPLLAIDPVRNSDMNHTPDMRSRAFVPEWATILKIQFASPILNSTTILNLLNAAGLFIGVGDWRNEKGSGSFGQFEVLSKEQAMKDSRFIKLLTQGREVQTRAMEAAQPNSPETSELLEFWREYRRTRGTKAAKAEAALEEEEETVAV